VRELEEQLQQAATELQQMQQEGERVRELEEQLQQAATELQQMQQQLSEV
jgi:DNA repair ATPase RecN